MSLHDYVYIYIYVMDRYTSICLYACTYTYTQIYTYNIYVHMQMTVVAYGMIGRKTCSFLLKISEIPIFSFLALKPKTVNPTYFRQPEASCASLVMNCNPSTLYTATLSLDTVQDHVGAGVPSRLAASGSGHLQYFSGLRVLNPKPKTQNPKP